MYVILSSAACLALQYFTTLSHKRHDLKQKKSYRTQSVCFGLLYKFGLSRFSFLEELSEILSKMGVSLHVKYPFFMANFK